jgi:hypothetical protein
VVAADALLALSRARLFQFDEDAESLLDQFVSELGLHDERGQIVRQFVGLSAAELSVVTAYAQGEPLVPVKEPFRVLRPHVELACDTTDSTIDWPCLERVFGGEGPLPVDVTLFSGHAIKLAEAGWSGGPILGPERIDLVRRMEDRYRSSPVAPAQRFADSGAVKLQGLIWHVKLAVARGEDVDESIAMCANALGIMQGYR